MQKGFETNTKAEGDEDAFCKILIDIAAAPTRTHAHAQACSSGNTKRSSKQMQRGFKTDAKRI